jgi:glycosyltransferase involved in cell wall biosynthesis
VGVWHVTHQDSKFWPVDPRIPVILTVHDLNFLREKPPHVIRRRLKRLSRKVARATVLTTGSWHAAREIGEYLPLRGKPIEVIPHGVCLDRTQPSQRPAAINPSGRFLFTIGDMGPKKNFHVLVDLIEALPDYSLVIAGSKSSEYAASIERRVAERGLGGRVVLTGRVSEAERNWLYEYCAAFVFPSLTEGFGLPLIEAMSFGRPVFASRRTSLPEVGGPWTFYWDEFHAGHLVSVFRAGMETYASDPQYREKLQAWARRFSWPQAAHRYLDLYRSVAGAVASARPLAA